MRRAVAWSMTNSSLCSTASSTRLVTLLRSNRRACSWKRSWLFTKFTARGRAEAMELQLRKIQKLHGRLELLSGLRIGASESEIRIGGVDNQVIRHPHTGHPYIPGSSLKGKVRSLLEWLSGAVKPEPLSYKDIDRALLVKPILQLFGVGGGDQLKDNEAAKLGPTRLAFWDAPLNEQSSGRGQDREPDRSYQRRSRASPPGRARARRCDLRFHGLYKSAEHRRGRRGIAYRAVPGIAAARTRQPRGLRLARLRQGEVPRSRARS